MARLGSVARYEFKLQLRSLVFWLGVILIAVMLYSEVIEPTIGSVRLIQWASDPTAPASRIQGDESAQRRLDLLRTEGLPTRIQGPVWADRMAIVFAFAAVFIAAFTFERDRLAGSREVLDSRPVSALQYFAGKYLGIVAALLIPAALSLVLAVAVNTWAQVTLGHAFVISLYFPPALVLLVTLLYVPALVMVVALAIGRAAAVIPLFLVYLYTAIAVWPVNFILRSDDTDRFWTMISSGAAFGNRLIYAAAAVALLAAGGWLYGRRRVAG